MSRHLLGAHESLSDMPDDARFNWRAPCEWVMGAHARSTIAGLFGLGKERQHRAARHVEGHEIAAKPGTGIQAPPADASPRE